MHTSRAVSSEKRLLPLGEVLGWLEADGLVGAAEADRFRHFTLPQLRVRLHPLIVLAEQKWKDARPPHKLLHIEMLTEWLAGRLGLPYYPIDPLKIDVSAVGGLVSSAYAERFSILPVEVNEREVVVATAEPYITEWEAELTGLLGRQVRRVFANPIDIGRYLTEFFNLARSVKRAARNQDPNLSGIGNLEQLVEMGRSGRLEADDQHIVHIVDWLMQYAFEQRASDIHLEPRREAGIVRFRIDGVLHQVYQIPPTVMNAVTSRIKILGRMDVSEKRRPQDGRIKSRTPDGEEIELRLSTMPTTFGEKLVMRIFNPDVLVKDFRELGFSDDDQNRWQAMTRQPNGIILVTGPTGSGKTTTLYSTLKQIAVPEVNVCTVEDPVEMVEPQFNQMQVQHNIGLDFASGIRTLMRQDPDVIMVGEIRDLETAEMAIQAALTGHLVLSTLHTNDAPAALTRLRDLGVPPYLINATLLGVLAQRLVRTLCRHCKQPGPLDAAAWNELVAPWKATPPTTVYQAEGCLECRMTGYMGRVGLYEMLSFTPGLRRQLTTSLDEAALRELAYREGMKPLRLSGALKIASGLTSMEEVLKVVPPAKD